MTAIRLAFIALVCAVGADARALQQATSTTAPSYSSIGVALAGTPSLSTLRAAIKASPRL
jgi:hypothetical protein